MPARHTVARQVADTDAAELGFDRMTGEPAVFLGGRGFALGVRVVLEELDRQVSNGDGLAPVLPFGGWVAPPANLL